LSHCNRPYHHDRTGAEVQGGHLNSRQPPFPTLFLEQQQWQPAVGRRIARLCRPARHCYSGPDLSHHTVVWATSLEPQPGPERKIFAVSLFIPRELGRGEPGSLALDCCIGAGSDAGHRLGGIRGISVPGTGSSAPASRCSRRMRMNSDAAIGGGSSSAAVGGFGVMLGSLSVRGVGDDVVAGLP